MKILAIGDPHGDLAKVRKIALKGIDLILLTGDLGSASLIRKMAFENIERKKQGLPEKEFPKQQRKKAIMEAYDSTIKLVKYLSQSAPVYTIFGNVESSNSEIRKHSKEMRIKLPFLYNALTSTSRVRIINNVVANFEGIRIGGLAYFVGADWVERFKPSDFKERIAKAKRETEKAKSALKHFGDVDILVCHQPPYGILDKVTAPFAPKSWQGKHAGSKLILDYIKRHHPRYVFCGHIHEGEGMQRVGKTEVYNLGVAGCKIIII